MKKEEVRTQKIAFFWRWWDEAEHKSSPEKRLAFYDALFRYIFRGEVPEDPLDMPESTGIDWAAYDAVHYFDVIDSAIEGLKSGDYGKIGGRSKKNSENKNPPVSNLQNPPVSNLQNPPVSNLQNPPVIENQNPPLSMNMNKNMNKKEKEKKNKNIESECSVSTIAHAREVVVPTIERVLQECRRSTRYPIDEAFATEWYGLMDRNGWKNAKGESILSNWNVKLSYAWMDEQKRKRDIKEREDAKQKAAEEAALEAQRREDRLQKYLLSESPDD